jgi:hypothetical protein
MYQPRTLAKFSELPPKGSWLRQYHLRARSYFDQFSSTISAHYALGEGMRQKSRYSAARSRTTGAGKPSFHRSH